MGKINNNILYFFILSFIFMYLNVCDSKGKTSNNIIDINCKTYKEKGIDKLKLILTNNTKNDVYIFLSHWEINGLFNKNDYMLGFPHDSYIVNRILFVPKDKDIEEQIITRGDKADYPVFQYFPKVLKLGHKNSQCIILEFNNSILKKLQFNKYRFSCEISFSSIDEWKLLEKKVGKKINKALLEYTKKSINIKIEKISQPNECFLSKIKINPEYSGMIRRTFDNFILCKCNLETDWSK